MIKNISRIVFLIVLFLFVSASENKVMAHFAGAAPYLKINGQFSILYHVPLNSIPAPDFNLPEDDAPDTYVVNQNISFELDKNFLPISREDLDNAQFDWDFGDGTTASGFVNNHTYQKMGSYFLTIHIKNAPSYVSPYPSWPLEKVLINVLPDHNYRLPQAVIKVDGRGVADPLTDYLWVDFSRKLVFDGSQSKAGSSSLMTYLYDFGDQTSAKGKKVYHQYDKTGGQSNPVLRVIDDSGLISDTYVELDNSLYGQNVRPIKTNNLTKMSDLVKRLTIDVFKSSTNINYGLLGFIFVVAFLAGAIHALTPGHGKTIVAAYLVGRRESRIGHVLTLAASITVSHTLIIYLLGFVFLILNLKYPISAIIPYFNKIAGILVLLLALNLISKGISHFFKSERTSHNQDEQKRNILITGMSGGLVPCIDALAFMILAAGIGQILFGLLVVFIFSLGLAATIVVLGFLVVIGKKKFKFDQKLGKIGEIYLPLISGTLILLYALKMLLS